MPKILFILAIVVSLLLAVPCALLIHYGEADIDASGMERFSIVRPCGSGYQRAFSVPSWLLLPATFASFVLPVGWVVRRVGASIRKRQRTEPQERGFEVILKHPPQRRE